jgi:hypothetical protein
MYISDVFPLVSPPRSTSRRRGSSVALAVAVAFTLLVAGIVAAVSYGVASTHSATLPQQRDLAPAAQFRDPQTHALLWIGPSSAGQPAATSGQQSTRAHYPGK